MAFKGSLTVGCFLCAVFCVSTSYILHDNLIRGSREVHVVKRGAGVEARISALRSLQDRLRQQRLQTIRESNYQRPRRENLLRPKENPEANIGIYGQQSQASENHRQPSENSILPRRYPMRQPVASYPYGEAKEDADLPQNLGRFRVPPLVREDYPRQRQDVDQSPDLSRQRERPSLGNRFNEGYYGFSRNVDRRRLQNVHEQEKGRPEENFIRQSESSDTRSDKGLETGERQMFDRPPSLDSDTDKEKIVVDEVEEEEAKEKQQEIEKNRYAQLQARLAQVMREKMEGASRPEPETDEMKPEKDVDDVMIDETDKEPEVDEYEKALKEEEEKQKREEEQRRLEQEARERNEALRKRWEAQMRQRRMRNLRRTG